MRTLTLASVLGLLGLSFAVACGDDSSNETAAPTAGRGGAGGQSGSSNAAGSTSKGGTPSTGGTLSTGGTSSDAGAGGSPALGGAAGSGGAGTFCDDYCAKLAPLNCEKQSECVAGCQASASSGAKCPTESQAYGACLASKSASDFECKDGAPRPKAETCAAEGAALFFCVSGSGGAGGAAGSAGAGGSSAGAGGTSAGAAGSAGAPATCAPACTSKQTCVDGKCKLKDGQDCTAPDQCASNVCSPALDTCVPADPGTCTANACAAPSAGICSTTTTASDSCTQGRAAKPSCTLGPKAATCDAKCECILVVPAE